MESSRRLIFRNNTTELDRFRGAVEEFISDDLGEIEKNRVVLALDEAFVNILEHGFPEGEASEIELRMSRISNGLEFELLDRAVLFDPTAAKKADIAGYSRTGAEGGLGIHLYSTIMKIRHQVRPGGGNCLTLFKAVP